MMRFSNKVAWISGAGGYIGGTTARMLAAEGAAVAVCDINEACVEKTVSAIVGAGGKAVGIVCDITNSASVDAAVQKAVETFGRLDIMVHVAGGSARGRMKGLKNRVKLRADLPVVDEICRTVVVLKQRAVSNKSFAVNRTAGAEKLILPVYGVTDGDTCLLYTSPSPRDS